MTSFMENLIYHIKEIIISLWPIWFAFTGKIFLHA